jgi:hypothetical protein
VIARYQPLPEKKDIPPFMIGTIWERVDMENIDGFPISGFGLVVNLDHTGNNDQLPTVVKTYMIKEMLKEGFGNALLPDFHKRTPESVIADDRTSVVQVDALLPPGVRKGQQYDVRVSVLPRATTTSLAGGTLYRTDLAIDGADSHNPVGKINVRGQARGTIFLNPAYALGQSGPVPTRASRAALRSGVILGGGVADYDRPIFLRLRQPQASISRAIEQRIISRFKGENSVASAHDEGKVEVFVPPSYGKNWQHFMGVVLHTYLSERPEFETLRARQLADEALKTNARLGDISYCWEAIGPAALPFLSRLITDPNPSVAFAAARAGAFIGDPTEAAQSALLDMARTPDHPFQLEACEVLGELPSSPAVNRMLRDLLNSEQNSVRLEAYRVLAQNNDSAVYSKVVPEDPNNQKFILDIVPSQTAPIIYATRSGDPRIAIIGRMPKVMRPIVFSAMNNRLTISSRSQAGALTMFYRDPDLAEPVKMYSNPDLGEVLRRLGGDAAPDETTLNFTYGQIVAILMGLSNAHELTDENNGLIASAPFVLQDPPQLEKMLAAPVEPGRSVKDSTTSDSLNATPTDAATLATGRGHEGAP